MALTNSPIQIALNWATLTEPVTRILNTLPKPLPDFFYNRTVNVMGDRYRRVVFRPTRQAARWTPYGSPPRAVKQTGAGMEDVVLIHSSEQIDCGPEVLNFWMKYNDLAVQQMAEQELDRRATDFGVRQMNLRNVCIHQMISNSRIYFDANGDLHNTDQSGSGGYTIDYKLPAGNIAAAGVDFSSGASNVVNYIVGFQRDFLYATGREIEYAIYGKNVAQYLANNTSFKEYLRYARPVADQYINTGLLPNAARVLNMTWVPAHTAHFERADGTVVGLFPDDQITFLPAMGPDMYDLKLGTVPTPKAFYGFKVDGDLNDIVREMLTNQQAGAVRYAYGTAFPTPQVTMVQCDTFYPDLKNPNCMYLIDTTP